MPDSPQGSHERRRGIRCGLSQETSAYLVGNMEGMQFREDYVERLRSCLEKEKDWHHIERCFREGLGDEEVEDASPIVLAFGYMLVASRREELRERVGVFGSQFELGNQIFPKPLAEIDDDMLDLWASYADATQGFALAASRLNDLLWVRRHGEQPVDRARAAFDGYLSQAGTAETMELVDCLQRAIEIAAEIGDETRLEAAINKALDVSRSEISDTSERRPGVPLSLIEAIVDLKPDLRPDGLLELLDAAADRYGADPYIAESANQLKQKLSTPEEREELQRQQVERWREEGKKGDALLRYSRLQQALGLARTHGFTEVAEEILLEMQSMESADFDFKPITAEVEIPTAEIDAFVKSFQDSESWQDALRRLGSERPPSGEAEENKKLTKELAAKYPLQRLFGAQIMGPHGSLTAAANSEEEHDRVDLARHESMQIGIWASIGVAILDAINEAFDVSDRESLTEFFTTELIDREVAARIADGVLRFFNGDDDGALHILVPQLEAAIRAASARAGVVVIKNPSGGTPGGVRALGGILADLKGRLDESWRRYLANALTDPLGINLRNQLSHGLHGPTSRNEVAIAIQIACHLRGWRRTEPDGDENQG